MTAFVDTNVLIRHLTGDPPDLAARATAFLAAADELLLPDLIVAEVVYVLESFYVVAADEIIDHHLSSYTPRVSNLLRVVLLPSYLAITFLGIAWIIP